MSDSLQKRKWKRKFRQNPGLRTALLVGALVLEIAVAALVIFLVIRLTKRAADLNPEPTKPSAETVAPTESETPTEPPTESESETESESSGESETPTESEPESSVPPTETRTPTVGPVDIRVDEGNNHFVVPATVTRLFIGDSRMAGMEMYTTYDKIHDGFLTGVGEGYYWLRDTAIPELERLLAAGYPIEKVYLNLGVNDCAYSYRSEYFYPQGRYAPEMNALAERHPELEFYFVSVGPSDESKETYGPDARVDLVILNQEVHGFNEYIHENCLRYHYVDAGEYLERVGFTSGDGIHYDHATYQKMYEYILQKTK